MPMVDQIDRHLSSKVNGRTCKGGGRKNCGITHMLGFLILPSDKFHDKIYTNQGFLVSSLIRNSNISKGKTQLIRQATS